jgi:alpha-1,2-mannosyltransferase
MSRNRNKSSAKANEKKDMKDNSAPGLILAPNNNGKIHESSDISSKYLNISLQNVKVVSVSESSGRISFRSFFVIFLGLNALVSVYNHIDDTDETFGYWEPLHYLAFGRGMQTWEYAPQFAIRTYAFIVPMLPFTLFYQWAGLSKIEIFHGLRLVLATLTAYSEASFLDAVQSTHGTACMRMTGLFLAFSPGILVAATAFLPSAVIMSFVMLSAACWMHGQNMRCVFWGCVAVLLTGWPYVGVVFLPMGIAMLVTTMRAQGTLGVTRLVCGVLLCAAGTAAIACVIDRYYYGSFAIPSINAFQYNAGGSGDNLYGIEPLSYYIRNLALTMGLAWPLAAAAPVMLLRELHASSQSNGSCSTGDATQPSRIVCNVVLATSAVAWLALLFSRPHKEERFL